MNYMFHQFGIENNLLEIINLVNNYQGNLNMPVENRTSTIDISISRLEFIEIYRFKSVNKGITNRQTNDWSLIDINQNN